MEEIVCFLFVCSIIGTCSAANPLAKIIGGSTVDIKDYPYQVSIRYTNNKADQSRGHFCGGSIIDKSHVLTAAHCLRQVHPYSGVTIDISPNECAIHAGTSTLNNEGNVYKIMNIINHPDFDVDTNENDIAILKLSKPIEFSDTQRPVELPTQNIKNGMEGTVTGWGDTKGYHMPSFSNNLKKLTQTLADNVKCKDINLHRASIPDTQLCGYNITEREPTRRDGYTGFCTGDSGGPLVADNKLVGIVSYTLDYMCAATDADIYTNVYMYADFIKIHIKN